MSNKIQIKGLRGSIYQRGKNSFRVQLSLGRNADGTYDIKRETIRGTKQDAIDLLTRWNVEYLDNIILPSAHQTVKTLYKEWIEEVKIYQAYNTHRFYKEKWESYGLEHIGHKRITEVRLADLQNILRQNIGQDRQLKNAFSPFFTWCVNHKKIKENPCLKLKIISKQREKTEESVWSFEEVKTVYGLLTFDNLYDIFIVLGVELGLRPQEVLGLQWNKVHEDHIAIEQAVKKRTPSEFQLGNTKTNSSRRYLPMTPFVKTKLYLHRENQKKIISKNTEYINNDLVVADSNGHVPCLRYIRRYMQNIAKQAGVKIIPPKNLRTTYISLMNALGVPLSVIQQSAGHGINSGVTSQHYIHTYFDSLRSTAQMFHDELHAKEKDKTE